MIMGNKIAHEWMNEYVSRVKSLATAKPEEMVLILSRANAYKYRLVEELGETEFNKQMKLYVEKYDKLGFL